VTKVIIRLYKSTANTSRWQPLLAHGKNIKLLETRQEIYKVTWFISRKTSRLWNHELKMFSGVIRFRLQAIIIARL